MFRAFVSFGVSFLCWSSAFLGGCGNEPSESTVTTAYGKSDIQLLSASERDESSSAKAVGNLMKLLTDPASGEKFVFAYCSGVQISPKHILTASHCYPDDLIFSKSQIASDADLKKLAYRNFDGFLRLVFEGEKISASETAKDEKLLGDPLYINSELDYAIYTLQEEKENFVTLFQSAESIGTSQPAKVYGHPNGVPLAFAADCVATALSDGVFVEHDCDSLTGTSGGLLVDARTDAPIALHLAGPSPNSGDYYARHGKHESAEELAKSYGCKEGELVDGISFEECVKHFSNNRALAFSAIVADLMRNNPALAAAIEEKAGNAR